MPVLIAALLLVGIIIAGGAAAVYGQAPRCTSEPGDARSTQQIGDALDGSGRVTLSEAEATTIARGYVGALVNEGRVCFTPGAAHLSGKLPLGPVTPSFYASLGVDLSGSTPRTTNLDVKVGALPSLPGISDQAANVVSGLINQNLAQFKMDQPHAVEFGAGSATITRGAS